MINNAKSIAHEHILSIVHTESQRFDNDTLVRILDAGCGDGRLIAHLIENLPILNKSVTFEVYGFDVIDHGVQSVGFFKKTSDELLSKFASIPWQDRLVCISAGAPWPYPNEFFDIIVSNQVGEHVEDHNLFFSEIYRILKKGGFSVHLFPLKHYVWEGHLYLPFVHRIMNYDLLLTYIRLLSRVGLGKYKIHKKINGVDLNTYTERHADYMHYFTNYLSYNELLRLTKKYKLRTSFKYTQEFYTKKLRSMLSLKNRYEYSKKRYGFIDWILVFILKYINCITVFLEKKERYTKL